MLTTGESCRSITLTSQTSKKHSTNVPLLLCSCYTTRRTCDVHSLQLHYHSAICALAIVGLLVKCEV